MFNLDRKKKKLSENPDGFQVDTAAVDADPTASQLPEESGGFMADLFEWLDVLVSALVTVIIIFSLIFRVATIEGNSMRDTLHNGEKVIISRIAYTPKYGDIVVISRNYENSLLDDHEEPIIKRVIGVGGDTVSIDFERGIVSVNGKELKEDYTLTPTNRMGDFVNETEPTVYVPQGYVFVLGDNRNDSKDSRYSDIGLVNEQFIMGHAIFRIAPLDKIGGLLNE